MTKNILAVLLDSGDTLIDEGSQERGADEIVLRAELIPGAGEMVREVKRRHYALALVADGHTKTFQNILGQHGLFDLFDAHAISEEVGVEKPRPEIYRAALDRLGIPPADYGRVVMVGNNLERDVKGANALGLISVWIDWAPRRAKVPADASEVPMYTIRLPMELITLLEKLENNHETRDL